jgi:hypothetical protein
LIVNLREQPKGDRRRMKKYTVSTSNEGSVIITTTRWIIAMEPILPLAEKRGSWMRKRKDFE